MWREAADGNGQRPILPNVEVGANDVLPGPNRDVNVHVGVLRLGA